MVKILLSWLSGIVFTLLSLTSASQIIVSIPQPDTSLCINAQFVIPVMINSASQVDSLKLVINFPAGSLSFLSEKQRDPAMLAAGDFSLFNTNDTTVTIKWIADTPIDLLNNKIVELIFNVGPEPGYLRFNELQSYVVSNGTVSPVTFIEATIQQYPPLTIVIEEIDATCPEVCEANIAAYVRGGARPYNFLWNNQPSVFDSVKTKACSGNLMIKVTDANNCVLDTTFVVTELASSEIEIETTPDTVYIQNPTVNYSFSGDQSIVDWYWEFGDGSRGLREQNITHTYNNAASPDLENYTVTLYYVNESGCNDSSSVLMPVSEADLFIPNVFTPGGSDQINNYFQIAKNVNDQKIPIDREYLRMELIVFNRYGRKVYDNNDYRNNWDGDNLPEGTYFYRLNTFGYFRNETFKGAVTILR